MTGQLYPQEQRLLDYIRQWGPGVDIPTTDLYEAAIKQPAPEDHRTLQQRVGGLVSRINTKLEAQGQRGKIVPGDLKRSYRLTVA